MPAHGIIRQLSHPSLVLRQDFPCRPRPFRQAIESTERRLPAASTVLAIVTFRGASDFVNSGKSVCKSGFGTILRTSATQTTQASRAIVSYSSPSHPGIVPAIRLEDYYQRFRFINFLRLISNHARSCPFFSKGNSTASTVQYRNLIRARTFIVPRSEAGLTPSSAAKSTAVVLTTRFWFRLNGVSP